jgi:hypothetical protein
MGERRQENSESAGIDHFRARVGLVGLVAQDDSRLRFRGPDRAQGGRPGQAERSGVEEYGDYGTRSADLPEPGQVQSLGDGPAEVAPDRGQIEPFVRKIPEQYDASCAAHGRTDSTLLAKAVH